jgi:hypothetical protein
MSNHGGQGNPAELPGTDAAGEEWDASGEPELDPVQFETATSPRPVTPAMRAFVAVILGVVGVGILGLIVAMLSTFGR